MRNGILRFSVSGVLAMAAGSTWAQSPPEAGSRQLEEIIVTARENAENIRRRRYP